MVVGDGGPNPVRCSCNLGLWKLGFPAAEIGLRPEAFGLIHVYEYYGSLFFAYARDHETLAAVHKL